MDKNLICDFLLDRASGFSPDATEVSLLETKTTEIYYESGKIGMIRTTFNNTAGVKVIKNNRKGVATGNELTEEALAGLVKEACDNSAHAPEDDAEGICDEKNGNEYIYGALECDIGRLYDRLEEFTETVKKEYPSISFDSITAKHTQSEKTYKNSLGVEFTEKEGAYVFSPMFMAVRGEKSSSFNSSGVIVNDLNTPFIEQGQIRILLEETEKQIDTVSVEGKFIGDVIITPQCLEEFIDTVEGNFLSDEVIINGTSPYKDKIGKKTAAETVTVYCAPLSDKLADVYRTTEDGYEAKNMPLIEKGILKNFVLSRYGAARTGLKRSANDGGCYIMDCGDTPLREMIASTEKGIIMNRFSAGAPGVNGDITGVAKNSFLINNGKTVGALSETMFSGNLAQMLLDITQISKERINDGAAILPWVKISNVTVSGK